MTKTELKNKWDEFLTALYNNMERLKVDTYFKPLSPTKLSEREGVIYLVTVSDPNFFQSRVRQYSEYWMPVIVQVFGKEYNIQIIDKDLPEEEEPAEGSPEAEDSHLFPNYTFESFVAGPTNQLALAASVAVAEGYTKQYNPLFIYGGSGLGKTHLMHAIGQYVLKNKPRKKVLYVSSEMFTTELVFAIQNKTTEKFKAKYKKVDYLLFDDVQFIAGKKSTEDELFSIFENLYNSGKQIVFTSDKPPKELGEIPDRLRTRFAWGMPVDIQTPDYETRMAILKNKAIMSDLELTPELLEVLDVIAQNIQQNIRELEGAYNRVISYSTLTGQKLSKELVKKTLSEIFNIKTKEITPSDIKDAVSKYYGIKRAEIESPKRNRSIAYPRQIAIYLIRELCDYSYPEIGEFFGGRDHTTIMHSYEKISDEISSNKELQNAVENIKRNLYI